MRGFDWVEEKGDCVDNDEFPKAAPEPKALGALPDKEREPKPPEAVPDPKRDPPDFPLSCADPKLDPNAVEPASDCDRAPKPPPPPVPDPEPKSGPFAFSGGIELDV